MRHSGQSMTMLIEAIFQVWHPALRSRR